MQSTKELHNSIFILRYELCELSELEEAFFLFDYDKDGKIEIREISPVVRSVGLNPTEAELKEIMNDVSGSQQLFFRSSCISFFHLLITVTWGFHLWLYIELHGY